MAHNIKTLKAEIISALEGLPLESLELLSEFVAFLRNKTEQPSPMEKQSISEFPIINIDVWPENLSLRREDFYDERGR